MTSYIIRRLLLMIPTLLGISLVVFFTMALAPGGVSAALDFEGGGQDLRPEERQALRDYYNKQYGLDDPLPLQYLRWLHNVSPVGRANAPDPAEAVAQPPPAAFGFEINDRGDRLGFKVPDFGKSFVRQQPVTTIVMEALPITVLLNLLSIPVAYGIGVVTGVYAGRYRGQLFDVSTGVTFLALWSLPVMWVGVMLIGFLANKDYIQWFPTGGLHDTLAEQMAFLPGWGEDGFRRGWLLDMLWHLVLPVVCLSYGSFAFLSKLMRSSVLENLNADFVRTARAKGVGEQSVLVRHVLRNSLLPLITISASLLPALLSGSLIVEVIFSINGMGKLMIDAINTRDRDVVLSVTFVVSLISLLSLIVRDVLYAVADPRVSYE